MEEFDDGDEEDAVGIGVEVDGTVGGTGEGVVGAFRLKANFCLGAADVRSSSRLFSRALICWKDK